MKKKKICIEYPLNGTSGTIIWNALGTPHGLETWFADKVEAHTAKQYIFKWDKSEEKSATLLSMRAGNYVRFHWNDEEQGTFFELRIDYNELTESYTLIIIDFATPDEADDLKELWDSQVERLRRLCGV